MPNIPISQIVSINPQVVSAGGTQGTLDGLLLTQATGFPVTQPQVYFNAADVGTAFGLTSDEYNAALVYFAGILGGGQQPASLTIGRYASAATSAAVFGAPLTLTLAQLQTLSGTLIVTTDTQRTSSTINLSGATSFANAASLMTAGFTTPNFAITYDAQRRRFVLSTTTTGATASVSAVTGTLADGVGLSTASGAYVEGSGLAADTATSALDRLAASSSTWAIFTTAWAASLSDRTALAQWTSDQVFRRIYAAWDQDAAGLSVNNVSSFGNIVKTTPYSNTIPVYGSLANAMIVLAWGASTNLQIAEGRTTLALRSPVSSAGVRVDNLANANALLSNGYTYLGKYASATNTYTVTYNGAIGGQFLWADTALGWIALRRNLQQALFETLLAYRSLPYNADGYNALYQGAQDVVSQFVAAGVIRAGVALSASQRAQIDQAAGVPISGDVVDKGWYLQVIDPITTTVRTDRGSPTVNFWYCDGGSIQRVVVSATTVI
ncbi:hypothetical protein [Xanthomonas phage pXoo2107]|nr:hypothetical protein [Xanthomonas phage pXoo2107]